MRPSRTRGSRSRTSCRSRPCCRSASNPCASGICRWAPSPTASSPSSGAERERPCRRESPTVSATTDPGIRRRGTYARHEELAPRGHGVEDGRDGEAPRHQVPADRLSDRGAQHPDGPLRSLSRRPRVPRVTMYGVVVCPRCKRAKGVDLKQKTTTCLCGFEIRVVPARVRARANTARELAPLVGQVSAEIAGGLKAYREAAAPVRRTRP